jgi:hypothetical protein
LGVDFDKKSGRVSDVKSTYIICDENYDVVSSGTYEQIDDTFGLAISDGSENFELSTLKHFVKTQKLFEGKLKLFVEVD